MMQSNKEFTIPLFGDSHSNLFKHDKHYTDCGLKLDLNPTRGATISGFGKRKSTLLTKSKIDDYISNNLPSILVVKFGQVDVDLGFYYRLIVKGEKVEFEAFSKNLIEIYTNYLFDLQQLKLRVIVCGINLPAIRNRNKSVKYTSKIITENVVDSDSIEKYKKKLRQVMPSIKQRTEMSINFNTLLRKYCENKGIIYFDLLQESLCPETKILDDKFHNYLDNDQHYLHSHYVHSIFSRKLAYTITNLTQFNAKYHK